jgi:hypothetical protein
MCAENHLYAMELPGFWMDVGQPKDYLLGIGLYLSSLKTGSPELLATGKGIVGPVMIVSLLPLFPSLFSSLLFSFLFSLSLSLLFIKFSIQQRR